MNVLRPMDFRSTRGIMLRGKNINNGVSHTPNPRGINTQKAATLMLQMRKGQKKFNAH